MIIVQFVSAFWLTVTLGLWFMENKYNLLILTIKRELLQLCNFSSVWLNEN